MIDQIEALRDENKRLRDTLLAERQRTVEAKDEATALREQVRQMTLSFRAASPLSFRHFEKHKPADAGGGE